MPNSTAVVSTLGILLESDYKTGGLVSPLGLIRGIVDHALGSKGNPLDPKRKTYEKYNRDAGKHGPHFPLHRACLLVLAGADSSLLRSPLATPPAAQPCPRSGPSQSRAQPARMTPAHRSCICRRRTCFGRSYRRGTLRRSGRRSGRFGGKWRRAGGWPRPRRGSKGPSTRGPLGRCSLGRVSQFVISIQVPRTSSRRSGDRGAS